VSVERDELRELVERLPEEQVPAVPVDLRPGDYRRAAELVQTYADMPPGDDGRNGDRARRAAERHRDRHARPPHFTVVRPSHISSLTLLP
jgi:hypothetical protein